MEIVTAEKVASCAPVPAQRFSLSVFTFCRSLDACTESDPEAIKRKKRIFRMVLSLMLLTLGLLVFSIFMTQERVLRNFFLLLTGNCAQIKAVKLVFVEK